MRVRAIVEGVERKYSKRRLPHGLFGLGHLVKWNDPLARRHRQLWRRGGGRSPIVAHFIFDIVLYLRFLTTLPKHVRALRRANSELARQVHWIRLVLRSIAWAVPPSHLLRLGLDEPATNPLHYVFDHEISAWLQERDPSDAHRSRELLADKQRFAEIACAHDIPVPPTIVTVTQGSTESLSQLLADDGSDPLDVFCKLRSANRAIGAFQATQTHGEWTGRRLMGDTLGDTAAVELAWAELTDRGDVLVQPLLHNCDELQRLTDSDEVVTIRAITLIGGEVLVAFLEVPVETGYAILPIHADTGSISLPENGLVNRHALSAHQEVLDRAGEEFRVPQWDAIVSASARAHAEVAVWAVAWDWAIDSTGPVLLEGNPTWSPTMPQIIGGGFLDPSHEISALRKGVATMPGRT